MDTEEPLSRNESPAKDSTPTDVAFLYKTMSKWMVSLLGHLYSSLQIRILQLSLCLPIYLSIYWFEHNDPLYSQLESNL